MRSEQKIAGLVIVKKELPLARAIEDLVLLLECSTERDVENQVPRADHSQRAYRGDKSYGSGIAAVPEQIDLLGRA
ncbi:MAG TPA: hypothetical protein VKO18_02550 [Terriglobia bacterium]|nr:hypothetical protein [Terriglobia bacterium]